MGVVDVILGEAVSRRSFLKMLGIGAGSAAVPWSTITAAAEKTVPKLFSVAGNGTFIPVESVPTNAIKTAFGYVTPIKLPSSWQERVNVASSIIYDKSIPVCQELARESGVFTNIAQPIIQALNDGTMTRAEVSQSPHMPAIKQSRLRLKAIGNRAWVPSIGETLKSPESIKLIYGIDVNSIKAVQTHAAVRLRDVINATVDAGHIPCPEVINLYDSNDGLQLIAKIRKRMPEATSQEAKAHAEKTVKDMEKIKAKKEAAEVEQVNRRQQQQRDAGERWEITRNPHAVNAPRMDWAGGSEDDTYNAYSVASESKRVIDAVVGSNV